MPKPKSKTAEYTNFENALRKVLQVSNSEMKARIEAAKTAQFQKNNRCFQR